MELLEFVMPLEVVVAKSDDDGDDDGDCCDGDCCDDDCCDDDSCNGDACTSLTSRICFAV